MKTSSKIVIAAAAVGAWLLAKGKKAISGIGKVIKNDFREFAIATKDGKDAICLYVQDSGYISVEYIKKYGRGKNSWWETWLYDGSYDSLDKAVKAAIKLKRLYAKLDNEIKDADILKLLK